MSFQYVLKNKPILHLNLTKKWFDLIESGKKKEEYRELSKHWAKYLLLDSGLIKIKGKVYDPKDVWICFSNGYSTDRRQMLVEIVGYRQGFGKQSWGAEPQKVYNCLILGKVLNKVD